MYEDFYGFREKPFSLLPDPEFLYFSAKHSSAFSVLEYGLTGQAGFTVVSGEVGSGKTTLLRHFLQQVGPETTIGLISNTPRDFGSLLRWIMYAFELDYQGKETVELYEAFTDFMIGQYAAGRRCVLIIDEAQNLAPESLEELRMLSNVNSAKDLLLQVILVGQPELAETLNRPDMQQFAQRVAISYHLKALTREETHAYVRHRLTVAGGGDAELFTEAAIAALHILSRGVPRLINSLCDIALVYGFGEEMPRIDLDTILAVMEDRSQSGQWLGAETTTLEQLRAEVRRLESTRSGSVAARPALVASRHGAGAESSFTVVPVQAKPATGPREVVPLTSPAIATDPTPKPLTARHVPSQGAADRPRTAGQHLSVGAPTTSQPTTSQDEPGASTATPRNDSNDPAAPAAQAQHGPRLFLPEFTASRLPPVPVPFAYTGKVRWILAGLSLVIFVIGVWLALAAPKFNF